MEKLLIALILLTTAFYGKTQGVLETHEAAYCTSAENNLVHSLRGKAKIEYYYTANWSYSYGDTTIYSEWINPNEIGPGKVTVVAFVVDGFTTLTDTLIITIYAAKDCATLGREETHATFDKNVYPNPSTGIININLPHKNTRSVSIYSISGSLVKKIELNKTAEVLLQTNINNLLNGLYIIVADDGSIIGKVLKQ